MSKKYQQIPLDDPTIEDYNRALIETYVPEADDMKYSYKDALELALERDREASLTLRTEVE